MRTSMNNISISQACAMSGLSRQRFHTLRRQGRGPAEINYRVGKVVRTEIPVGSFMKWLIERDYERAEQLVAGWIAATKFEE